MPLGHSLEVQLDAIRHAMVAVEGDVEDPDVTPVALRFGREGHHNAHPVVECCRRSGQRSTCLNRLWNH